MKQIVVLTLVSLLIANPSWAGFAEAVAAYKRGDYATALREWRPIADQGHASVQYNMGVMYANGLGVRQDDEVAAQWLAKAANKGYPQAQYAFGLMYSHGRGVPRDYGKAVGLLSPLAEEGVDDAQYVMGVMHENGGGVPQDFLHAYKWYNLAASKGNKRALKARDNLAARMTIGDISSAQRLSREWLSAFKQRRRPQ